MTNGIADRLRLATSEAQQQFDLPDYLALRILAIADRLERCCQPPSNIDLLLEQIPLYDTYGQTGYLGMGVNHLILDKTIERIEGALDAKDE